jgi:hypothetical protein
VGLYRQPNDFSCGPYALKHALTMLGITADPVRLAKLAKVHWWSGSDEVRLARAARAHDCSMPLVRRYDADEARRAMVKTLREGHPLLLCVDDWEHWITVVHHSKGRFVVLDSEQSPVVIVLDWKALRERWVYRDEDIDGTKIQIFDMFPVRPKHAREGHARFEVARAHKLRRPENRDLALCWDRYLEDLREICRPRSPLHVDPITLGELIARHDDILIDRVVYWHGDVEKDDVRRVLRNLRFVADTYGMVIPASSASQRRALADLVILLALWSAGKKPLEPLYVPEPRKRRRRRAARTTKKKAR